MKSEVSVDFIIIIKRNVIICKVALDVSTHYNEISYLQTLMNAHPGPCTTVVQVPSAPTVCQDMSANVLPVTKEMVAPDVWLLRSELAATLTLIVQTMPSVERTVPADVDQDLKQSMEYILYGSFEEFTSC